jgi:hypothetical protein
MQEITCHSRIPFEQELDAALSRIPQQEIGEMEARINVWADEITDDPNDFFASNWKTGSDWTGTPFQPLYEAIGDIEDAGKRLGSLVRRVIVRRVCRGERWYMYRNPEAGTPECPRQFWGTFYWRHQP